MTYETKANQINKYKQQMNGYVKEFTDAIADGIAPEALDKLYGELDKRWRKTAGDVNKSNRGFILNVNLFENKVKALFDLAKRAEKHETDSANAETIFIKEVMLPVAIAVAVVTLFLIGVNLY
jgi:hypothetical protein